MKRISRERRDKRDMREKRDGWAINRLRKDTVVRRNFIGLYILGDMRTPRRMLKESVQQGRSKRRGEEVPTALCGAVRPC